VVLAYEPAHQEASSFGEDWPDGTATPELLKKYMAHTKYVMAFVLEIWPDLIFEPASN
jgi:hypothetical protein